MDFIKKTISILIAFVFAFALALPACAKLKVIQLFLVQQYHYQVSIQQMENILRMVITWPLKELMRWAVL